MNKKWIGLFLFVTLANNVQNYGSAPSTPKKRSWAQPVAPNTPKKSKALAPNLPTLKWVGKQIVFSKLMQQAAAKVSDPGA